MGHGLVELHSVRVVVYKSDGAIYKSDGASNEVYGEVKAGDCAGEFDIYKVEKENSNHLTADGVLPLMGPPRCIISPHCYFHVSLKERHLDLEVSNGYLNFYVDPPFEYSRPQSALIKGDHGYSVLYFSLFENAVQATVELVVASDIRKLPCAIHGEIFAEYSRYSYECEYAKKYHRTMLFNIPPDKAIKLGQMARDGEPMEVEHNIPPDKGTELGQMPRDGEPMEVEHTLPLSRCTVALPWKSWLVIRANLWINMGIETLAEVVSDELCFPSELDPSGMVTQAFEGKYGRIDVKVTWVDGVREKAVQEIIALRRQMEEMNVV